ncbi:rRNA biogenesis protein rrp36 [Diaporthe australafricana]|uniref:rRNA biogenesis protein RRP36 n=1 Tax=Diaporthe australafricana TaxID=127596 RepID=A0ABR3WTX0_9PEZI
MESRKRKLPQAGLERRVRARAEPEPDLDRLDEGSDSAPSEEEASENESASETSTGSESGDESDGNNESSEDDEEQGVSADASKISFGTLAKAQARLPQSGRRKKKGDQSEDGSAEDEDDAPKPREQSFKREKPPSRSSKHAPQEVSSKRYVSRRREIIPVKKVQYRDPRFDPLVTGQSVKTKADDDHARKAYAFLDEYRDDELRKLKGAIKKARTPAEKEQLERAYMSMESRKKARDKKDKERAVVEEHRRREKELVKQGVKSKPFYLKKAEQKKQLLTDQFSALSEKQREKAIEKKRKKVAGKEKKAMPMERRVRE